MTNSFDCDIFCKVIDNFGDIGVCWRLARQLAAEHGFKVRLWVDNLATFQRLAPSLDANLETQALGMITVQAWHGRTGQSCIAPLVIQSFGCDLPSDYLLGMSHTQPRPAWINLEYLSAESWVEDCHGLPSPHPQLPLTCHFFFPGFTPRTGGLLRESDLIHKLSEFSNTPDAQRQFWEKLGVCPPREEELKISLFSYPTCSIPYLLDAWARGDQPIFCTLPGGNPTAREWANKHPHHGCLKLVELPFLTQQDYDLLLVACDLNFVRGEDSFIRAQWAANPFVWHIYRQTENTHQIKLEAFLQRYLLGLDDKAGKALRNFWLAWENEEDPACAWAELLHYWPDLCRHAENWRIQLAGHEDLCARLLTYCQDLLQ